MKRKTPPLDAIEAFLQAVKSPTFRDAADALAISPSAYSRRIQALESFLGAQLFDRSAPRPVLNEAGRQYLTAIAPAIDAIGLASARPRRPDGVGTLRVSAPHTFTIGWLAPRLPSFLARADAPDVALTISSDLGPLQMGAADVGIVAGPRDWKGLVVEPLAALTGVLVSAPTLAGGRPPPRHLDEIAQHRLLAVVEPRDVEIAQHRLPAGTGPRDMWSRWLANVGYDGPPPGEPVTYDTASLLYEATAAGLGLAIAIPFLAERVLAARRVRRIGDAQAPLGTGYYLVCAHPAARRRPDVQAFCAWAHVEASATLAAFDAFR